MMPPFINAQEALRGVVVSESDSAPMPFVYIINKTTGHGVMSDAEGKFVLSAQDNDTIISAYIGYFKLFERAGSVKRNAKGHVRLVMKPMPFNLREVNVTAFKIKPYEREYMTDIIGKSKLKPVYALQSPITALYMQFSREGKELRKLARIFEQLLIDEIVQEKLSPEILARLTGDHSINYDAFRKYCYYVSDEFIVNHEGAELYSRVMECYHRYKKEMR